MNHAVSARMYLFSFAIARLLLALGL